MRLFEDVYLVGGGQTGLSHPSDSHVYLVDGEEEMGLIDVGTGLATEAILKNIEDDGLEKAKIKRILVTHSHADHASGAKGLRETLGARIVASEAEAESMRERNETMETGLLHAKREAVYPEEFGFEYVLADEIVKDGDIVKIGKYELRVIIMPGHSPGSTCYLLEQKDRRSLFCGDVVFINGNIGLLNFPGSELEGYRRNIRKLADLEIDALLPGHFLFTVRDGQKHIDRAIESLQESIFVPPLFDQGRLR
jgi:glyoxylase-like metal-dependent hydrolase (beta-lactamase superfamily II)